MARDERNVRPAAPAKTGKNSRAVMQKSPSAPSPQKKTAAHTEVVIGESYDELRGGVQKAETRKAPRVRTIRKREKKHLPVSTIFFMGICTMLVMFTVLNFVQINECTQSVSQLKSTLSKLQNEEKELQLELEKKNDLTRIRDEAGALGMMEDKDLTVVHVNLEKEDKFESFETEKEDYGVITTVMSALGQNIRSYWHIFGIGE